MNVIKYKDNTIRKGYTMIIGKTINNNEATLKPKGWLDTETSLEFAEELDKLEANITSLTLDLSELEYTSSAGLRQIVAAHKKMKGNLKIANTPPEIMQVFKMTGFDKKLILI